MIRVCRGDLPARSGFTAAVCGPRLQPVGRRRALSTRGLGDYARPLREPRDLRLSGGLPGRPPVRDDHVRDLVGAGDPRPALLLSGVHVGRALRGLERDALDDVIRALAVGRSLRAQLGRAACRHVVRLHARGARAARSSATSACSSAASCSARSSRRFRTCSIAPTSGGSTTWPRSAFTTPMLTRRGAATSPSSSSAARRARCSGARFDASARPPIPNGQRLPASRSSCSAASTTPSRPPASSTLRTSSTSASSRSSLPSEARSRVASSTTRASSRPRKRSSSSASGLRRWERCPRSSLTRFAIRWPSSSTPRRRCDGTPSERDKLLAIVEEEAGRLRQMVTDLLDFARPASVRLVDEPLLPIIESALDALRHGAAAADIDVEVSVDDAIPRAGVRRPPASSGDRQPRLERAPGAGAQGPGAHRRGHERRRSGPAHGDG